MDTDTAIQLEQLSRELDEFLDVCKRDSEITDHALSIIESMTKKFKKELSGFMSLI